MISDPIYEYLRTIVRRVLNDRDYIDYRARYAARVDSQSGDEVDVTFDDDRLPPLVGVPVAWTPGGSVTLRPGTRVTVGWLAGDERYPKAFLEWDGSGGIATVDQAASTSWKWTTPLGEFSAALKAGHLLNGYSTSVSRVTPGTAMGGGSATSVGGGDILCKVTFTEGGTPGAGPLFTLQFVEEFSAAPQVVVVDAGGTDATIGTITTSSVIVNTTKTLTNGNSYTVKLLVVG